MISTAAQQSAEQFPGYRQQAEVFVRIHLDANANAPATPAVKTAVLQALETVGNPSSAHAGGDEARAIITAARDAVAELCNGLFSEEVVFTSGCTEANNLIVGSARAAGATLIISAVEHPSVLRPAEAFQADGGRLIVLPVDGTGLVELASIEAVLDRTPGPIYLSIQAANSETGVMQPVCLIAELAAKRRDVLFHCDAAQAFGKFIFPIGGARAPHVVSVSAHKLHGPMGVGALLLQEGEDRVRPLMLGGDQERGLRAGTQSVPLIAGFGAACAARSASLVSDVAQMRAMRDHFETGVRAALPSIVVNGADAARLPNTSNLRFSGLDAMALIALLDAEGVLASQGSACHSRRPEPSPVLMAMGLSEGEAFASVRFSVSPLNTEAEINAAIAIVAAACHHLGLRA